MHSGTWSHGGRSGLHLYPLRAAQDASRMQRRDDVACHMPPRRISDLLHAAAVSRSSLCQSPIALDIANCPSTLQPSCWLAGGTSLAQMWRDPAPMRRGPAPMRLGGRHGRHCGPLSKFVRASASEDRRRLETNRRDAQRTHTRTNARTHTHSHAHTHARTHTRTGMHSHSLHARTHAHARTHTGANTPHTISTRLCAYTPTRLRCRPHTGPATRVLPPSRSARARACSRACDPHSAPRRPRYGAATPHFTRHRAVGNTQRNRLWPTTCGAALFACPARQAGLRARDAPTPRRANARRATRRMPCFATRCDVWRAPARRRTNRSIRTVDGRTTGAQGVLSEYSRSAPVRGRTSMALESPTLHTTRARAVSAQTVLPPGSNMAS